MKLDTTIGLGMPSGVQQRQEAKIRERQLMAEVAKLKEEHQTALEAQDASHSLISFRESRSMIHRQTEQTVRFIGFSTSVQTSRGLKRHQDESSDLETELQGGNRSGMHSTVTHPNCIHPSHSTQPYIFQ